MFNELFWMAAADAAGESGETSSMGSTIILLCILVAISLFLIKRNKKPSSGKSTSNKKTSNTKNFFDASFIHLYGLDLPCAVKCKIRCNNNGFEFEHGGRSFSLSMSKVINMEVTTTEHIETQLVSDAGAAIGGAMAFGSLGAYSGGTPRAKDYKTYTHILFITYRSDNDVKQILFDVAEAPLGAKRLVNACKKCYTHENINTVL